MNQIVCIHILGQSRRHWNLSLSLCSSFPLLQGALFYKVFQGFIIQVPNWFYVNYQRLGSVSTLTNQIIILFQKIIFLFLNYYHFHDLLLYCHMSSEIIQCVTYIYCNDFQQDIFTKKLFRYFQDYLMMKLTLGKGISLESGQFENYQCIGFLLHMLYQG
jgi:hypothetical protein